MSDVTYEQRRAGVTASKAIRAAKKYIRDEVLSGKGYISTLEVDKFIEDFIFERDCIPALINYKPSFHDGQPYKHASCISIDNEVVHGVPQDSRFITKESMVTVDLVVRYDEWHADTARTFLVDPYDSTSDKFTFLRKCQAAFSSIRSSVIQDISVEALGEISVHESSLHHLYTVREFAGHGIGKIIHDRPTIPFCTNQDREQLISGHAYAIEPIFTNKQDYNLYMHQDGWTYFADCLVAHFEDTIFITDEGEVLNLTN